MSLTKSNTRMLEGDVDASNITGVLPVANGGTGSSTGASGVFSESFESSELNITAGNTEVDHGLGVTPKIVKLVVRCKDAVNTQGYLVGDEVEVINPAGYTQLSYYSNATKCGISLVGSINLLDKNPSGAPTSVNASHWKLVLRAFA